LGTGASGTIVHDGGPREIRGLGSQTQSRRGYLTPICKIGPGTPHLLTHRLAAATRMRPEEP